MQERIYSCEIGFVLVCRLRQLLHKGIISFATPEGKAAFEAGNWYLVTVRFIQEVESFVDFYMLKGEAGIVQSFEPEGMQIAA
jgi:hypothetical protein